MKSTRPFASTFSVSQGYKPRRVTSRGRNTVQTRAVRTNSTAHEILQFLADEIVSATIDTLRVVTYLRVSVRGLDRTSARNFKYKTELGRDGMSPAEHRA